MSLLSTSVLERGKGIANAVAEMQGRPPVGPLDALGVAGVDVDALITEFGEDRLARNKALLTRMLARDAGRAIANGRYLRGAGMTLSARRIYEGGKVIILEGVS